MSNLREHVETLLNHSRVMRSIIAIAEEIDSAEKIETMVSDAKRRLTETNNEIEAAKKAAQKSLASIEEQGKKAEDLSKALVAKKEAEAEEIVAKAQAQAEALVSAAKAEASSLIAPAKAEREKVDAAVAASKEQYAKLSADLDSARVELEAVTVKVEETKAFMRKLIEG